MNNELIAIHLKLPANIYDWGGKQSHRIGLPSTESYFQLIIRMAWQCQQLGLTPTPAQVTQKHVLTDNPSMQDLEVYD